MDEIKFFHTHKNIVLKMMVLILKSCVTLVIISIELWELESDCIFVISRTRFLINWARSRTTFKVYKWSFCFLAMGIGIPEASLLLYICIVEFLVMGVFVKYKQKFFRINFVKYNYLCVYIYYMFLKINFCSDIKLPLIFSWFCGWKSRC